MSNQKEIPNRIIYKRQTLMFWLIFIVAIIISIYAFAEIKKINLFTNEPCKACEEYASKTNQKCVCTCFVPYDTSEMKPLEFLYLNQTNQT
jgi:hypothetical protein